MDYLKYRPSVFPVWMSALSAIHVLRAVQFLGLVLTLTEIMSLASAWLPHRPVVFLNTLLEVAIHLSRS